MSTVRDPVCGMMVDEKTAKFKSIHENKVYYFNSAACQAEFEKNPEKYMNDDVATRHASHYGAVCPTPGCGPPAKGVAWYLYVGLIALVLFTVLLTVLLTR